MIDKKIFLIGFISIIAIYAIGISLTVFFIDKKDKNNISNIEKINKESEIKTKSSIFVSYAAFNRDRDGFGYCIVENIKEPNNYNDIKKIEKIICKKFSIKSITILYFKEL